MDTSSESSDRIGSPIPEGLRVPDLIITRRTRTHSMSGRIEDHVQEGTVKFFCRSRGHGFIDPKKEVIGGRDGGGGVTFLFASVIHVGEMS